MANTVQIEWLNQNALRAYPFAENMQRRPHDASGTLFPQEYALPNSVLVDFLLSVSGNTQFDVFLKQFSFVGNLLTFVFASDAGIIASVTVDANTHTPYTGYRITGSGEFDDSVGVVVVGDLSNLGKTFPDGVYEYSKSETTFEARCIRPSLRNVRSLSILDPTTGYETKKMYGDIKLVAGTNISLRYDDQNNAIWISADNNAGYNIECNCDTVNTNVKSINGISLENVNLVGSDCVQVQKSEDGVITITDTCSKPCCGCAELAFVDSKINTLNTGIDTLRDVAGRISDKFTEFSMNYLASTTGRTGKLILETITNEPR